MSNGIGLLAGIGNVLNAQDAAKLTQAQNNSIGTAGQAAKILFSLDTATGQATPLGAVPPGGGGGAPPAGGVPPGPLPPIGAPPPQGPTMGGSPLAGSAGAPAQNLTAPVPQMPVGTPPNPAGIPQPPQRQLSLQTIMAAIQKTKPNISPEELWMTLNQFQPMLSSQDKQVAEQLKLQLQQMKDLTSLQNGQNKNSTNITIQGMKGDTAQGVAETRADSAEDVANTKADASRDVAGTRADASRDVAGIRADSAKDIQGMKGEQKLNEIKQRASAAVKAGVLTGAQKAQVTAIQKRADAENQTVQSLIRSGTPMDDPALQAALKRRNGYMDQLAGILQTATPPALPAAAGTPPTADAPSGVTVEEVK